MTHNHPDDRPHGDPGLQPERTVLAWGRTTLTLVTASAIFLRWIPEHGPLVLPFFAVSVAAGGGIYFTQRVRYRRGIHGITAEHLAPDIAAVLWTASSCVVLGALGLWLVLA
ncbi:DUF202 domain-containing protein [Arthrobacter sp. KBS0703]|uniref:DUF202 domain-containing protein n=1 Tax=Bacteria TaxID=2 RepID=UPI00098F29E5|nr:DUF202 domain-containing protein [Arthrobacter sp. KBS0703]TSE14687.1 DUF202 domain-containing protein [Arthrobacter sp. KBS0703]